ncbi:MAG: disulfide bond formation protein B, partial [Gammaproteobacteria bacterium]|nr:disulfide bond formation protein B [Gammaproteobacteria bacterium]
MDRARFNLAGAGIVLALQGYAYYAQYFQGYEPCPLCMFQRFALFPVAFVFVAAGLHNPAGVASRIYAVLGVLTAAMGSVVSGWHIYVQYTPNPPACLGNLERVLDVNPFFEAITRVFQNAGDCTEIDWAFLGLSMPTWVLIWFIALA